MISNPRRWVLVGLLFIASLVNYLDRATLSVALPAISHDFSLTPASQGLLLSAFFWSYALMQLPVGWLADRWSLRWLYAACFALWSLACGLTGIATSFGMLIVLRILLGVGESIYLPGSTKVVSESFLPQERGLPSSLFDCGTRAGLAVGVLAVAWLVARSSWRPMFMLVGFLALLWIIPWLVAFPRTLGNERQTPSHQEVSGSRKLQVTFNRNLLGSSLGFLCFGYYGYLLMTWLPDYLVEVRHLTILRAGTFASLPFFIWAIAEPAGGWVSDRMIEQGMDPTRVRKGVIAVAFLSGLLLIPATRAASVTAAITLICGSSLVGFGSGNILVIFQTCAPPREVGTWMGIGNFVGNIGGVLSPLVTGLLIGRTGSYFAGFALAPLVLLGGLLCFLLLVGKLEPPSPLKSC